MFRLIKTKLPTAGQSDCGEQTPAWLLHFGTFDTLFRQRGNLSFQIFAHQIELMLIVFSGRARDLSRRKGENQPAMSRVHGMKTENVFEEIAIGFGILTV